MGEQQRKLAEQMKREEEKGRQEPQNDKDRDQTRHDQESQGANPPVDIGALEGQRGQGRWGRLPKTVVESMYENGRRKLPEKYRILLEEYFRRLPTTNQK